MGVADGVEGDVAARDIAEERVEDASQRLKVGDTIEAKFTGMDRKGRSLQLSIKAKDEAETAETLAEYSKASSSSDASSGTTKLGALLREQRSEEHTSELQSLMRISYAVFCLKKKNTHKTTQNIYKYTLQQ